MRLARGAIGDTNRAADANRTARQLLLFEEEPARKITGIKRLSNKTKALTVVENR
jgi:hypothetical protein